MSEELTACNLRVVKTYVEIANRVEALGHAVGEWTMYHDHIMTCKKCERPEPSAMTWKLCGRAKHGARTRAKISDMVSRDVAKLKTLLNILELIYIERVQGNQDAADIWMWLKLDDLPKFIDAVRSTHNAVQALTEERVSLCERLKQLKASAKGSA